MVSIILFQCYPAKVLFESFSVDSNGLNPEKFEKICPALVEQIESKACLVEKEVEEEEDTTQSKSQGWYPVQIHHHFLIIEASLRYRQYSLVSKSGCRISWILRKKLYSCCMCLKKEFGTFVEFLWLNQPQLFHS